MIVLQKGTAELPPDPGCLGTLLFLKRQGLNITQAGPRLQHAPISGWGSRHVPCGATCFVYVYVPANLCVHHICADVCGGQKNVGSPETGLTDSYEPLCGCRKLNLIPLQEQPVL